MQLSGVTRILLLSWFDSNVCTILRHLSLIAKFICELTHFIMSCPFLKGLLSITQPIQRWEFGILVWTDTCFWNEEPNSSSKSGQSFAMIGWNLRNIALLPPKDVSFFSLFLILDSDPLIYQREETLSKKC